MHPRLETKWLPQAAEDKLCSSQFCRLTARILGFGTPFGYMDLNTGPGSMEDARASSISWKWGRTELQRHCCSDLKAAALAVSLPGVQCEHRRFQVPVLLCAEPPWPVHRGFRHSKWQSVRGTVLVPLRYATEHGNPGKPSTHHHTPVWSTWQCCVAT